MSELTLNDIFKSMNEEQRLMIYHMIGFAIDNGYRFLPRRTELDNHERQQIRNIYDSLNDEQRMLANFFEGQAIVEWREQHVGL